MHFQKILIIQTAFIGDVVLATPVLEKLHDHFPEAAIDFLLRKGNEGLLEDHPKLRQVLVWDKNRHKIRNLRRMIAVVRNERYDMVFNLQRFGATGLLTALSRARIKVGFKKNPFSFTFNYRLPHAVGDGTHEVVRNLSLVAAWTDAEWVRPKLYPPEVVYEKVQPLQTVPYVTLAPTSVWFTKQFPAHQWIAFLKQFDFKGKIYLIGAPADFESCRNIQEASGRENIENLCGRLSLMESVALMEAAQMNYVNDSAPLHFASATNAPTTAVFCSTLPEFGFGPLSSQSRVVQIADELYCRPCGLHGKMSCPEGHFKCANDIAVERLNF